MTALKCILVVDDDDAIRELVSMALGDEGYQVLAAWHGEEALVLAAKTPPDLILLDMRMPVMDGWEFAQTYRERGGPQAPIVVLTAARDVAEAAVQIGAAGYLAKPFDLEALLSTVARYTNSS